MLIELICNKFDQGLNLSLGTPIGHEIFTPFIHFKLMQDSF